MTSEHQLTPTKRFVPALLPWLLAAAFFLVYLITLNPWVSFGSLPQVARASGWVWQPEVYQPLNWLVTQAFHLLPARFIPFGLNLFAALCAVLSLALLARSVALLPHDRTEEQRAREKGAFSLLSLPLAWLPVLLATVLCGLQLTFWENATAFSSEMLDLLLFAYVIRSLLEFRIDERDSWLVRASLVYGLAITDNWAMIGFFPLFLVALVWLKGVGFFNLGFLWRMSLWGFVGILFYLLLPTVQSLSGTSPLSFWQILKTNLEAQKSILLLLPFNKGVLLHGFNGNQPFWVLGLPALLPVLVMGIRWPSYFGDPSKLGVALTTLIFHLFHAFVLFICAWVALDPQVSPRHLLPGLPMLSFYYLGALSAGYYSGYFLLVFGPRVSRRPRPLPFFRLLNTAATTAVCLLLLLATALLLYRNLPQIRFTNGPLLRHYVSLQTQALPPRNTVLLSDDANSLFLMQAATVQEGSSRRFLFLDTGSLPLPDYQRFLKQKYPQRWLAALPKDKDRTKPVDDITLIQILANLAQTNALYYLHPSFGYYFEAFYLEPHGTVYKLRSHALNSLLPPPLETKLVAENESFWTNSASPAFQPAVTALSPSASAPAFPESFLTMLEARLHLGKQQNSEAALLGALYSRALDYWGVQLQRTGRLPQAADRLAQALALNPDNRAALANLDANADLRAGRKLAVLDNKALEERFGKYRSLEPLMNENGPFDDPTLCAMQGVVFASGGNIRQAAELLTRTKALVPTHLPTCLWLAQVYNRAGSPDQALGIVQEIRTNADLLAASRSAQGAVLFIEMSADLDKKDLGAAESALRATLKNATNGLELLSAAAQAYQNHEFYSNALSTVEQQLRFAPDHEGLLYNKGWLCLKLGAYEQAIAQFTRVLKLETNSTSGLFDSVLFNRAMAYSGAEQFDAAQRDCEALQKNPTNAWMSYYGLGEIAYHKKDTNAALRNYQLFLSKCPANVTETNLVSARLKELKPGTR